MVMKNYCMILDLKDNPETIRQYEYCHQKDKVWPEIVKGIKEVGIVEMDIYRAGNRLVMLLTTVNEFDLERDFELMGQLPKQKEWAELMASFQQKLPFSESNDSWVLTRKIFDLND